MSEPSISEIRVLQRNRSSSLSGSLADSLLTATEVARWLHVSRAWVFEHSNGRRRPYLPSVKLGKSVRFRRADVNAFIEECQRFRSRGVLA
jgi:excisionase family DNA binding protein